MADVSDLRVSAEQAARQARQLGLWARVVLVPVAAIGAVLSFRSLYQAAVPTFGDYLAAGFPLLVDLLILGASLQYVAGAKVGRPMAGWRLTAHAGVVGTLVLNALAAKELGEVPWHVTAPAVWAVLVELTAKQVLGEWKATHTAKADVISLPLWMTAPVESVRTRLLMFRTGITNAHQARIAVGVNAAAREALRLALPKRNARRVRKIINRQLRAGSLTPVAILRPLGWTKGGVVLNNARPDVILQAVLQEVLDPGAPPAPIAAAAPPVVRSGRVQQPHPTELLEVDEWPGGEPEFGYEPETVAVAQPDVMALPEVQQPQVAGPARAAQPSRPAQHPATAPRPGMAPRPSRAPQPAVAQHPAVAPRPSRAPQSGAAHHPASAPTPGAGITQPGGAGLRPGTVQQPARALQLGRALHRGRVLQQTGSADSSATTAEQLRMELARQTPRFEPPRFDPEQQQVQEFRAGSFFDETEILEDMEHLDELDGQEYPEDVDGLNRGDYIDLDDPAGQRRAPTART